MESNAFRISSLKRRAIYAHKPGIKYSLLFRQTYMLVRPALLDLHHVLYVWPPIATYV
jgi:hypothetical protein